MLTFEQFKNKYIGKSIDYDGVAGAQCVDLIKIYLKECFGINAGAWGNAVDYWNNINRPGMSEVFTRIPNTRSLVVERGDIVVWNTNVGGGYGHVAVGLGIGDINGFQSLDQNWNGKYIKQVGHSFDNVIGVLRVKDKSRLDYPNGKPQPKPEKTNFNDQIKYRVHVKNQGWHSWVSGGNFTGTTGKGLQLEAVQFDFPFSCDVKAHIGNVGWVDYNNINKNTIIGTTGQGKRLEALVIKPKGNQHRLFGKVHIQNKGDTFMFNLDGNISLGTSGEGLQLEAITLEYKK